MVAVAGLKGLRHVALKVRDVRRARDFYRQFFGMEVVWEPDPKNVYLSSGCDNLALHESTEAEAGTGDALDHLGFVVESIERVRELEKDFRASAVQIVHSFKIHRDGSASFYCADPDGNVIQLLYEPHLSRQDLK